MISVILFKMSKHSDFHFIFFQIEGTWQDFTIVTKLIKNFKSLYGFGGRFLVFLKIRDAYMDFEPYFKVHNLVTVYPRSIILGQITNLNMIFHVVGSVYRLVKIWNSSQFPWWISGRPISYCVIVQVRVFLKRTVVGDWRFDNLSGSHLQSQGNSICQSMML